MRLGAPLFGCESNAESFTAKAVEKNYRAVFCPDYLVSSSQEREIEELKDACRTKDLVIAEVGAWCNPLSPDPVEARKAVAYISDRLRLADKLGAACCDNVIGSASTVFWYAPAAENYTRAFMERAVEVYSRILDEVQPQNTKMAFEVMPFCFLDCTDSYVEFLEMLHREDVAAHLDLVNLIHDGRTLYNYKALFRDAVDRIGSKCVSAHLKDIDIEPYPTNTRMNEVPIGTGYVSPEYMLECLAQIPGDLPLMLEHLNTEEEYDAVTLRVRQAARRTGIEL